MRHFCSREEIFLDLNTDTHHPHMLIHSYIHAYIYIYINIYRMNIFIYSFVYIPEVTKDIITIYRWPFSFLPSSSLLFFFSFFFQGNMSWKDDQQQRDKFSEYRLWVRRNNIRYCCTFSLCHIIDKKMLLLVRKIIIII